MKSFVPTCLLLATLSCASVAAPETRPAPASPPVTLSNTETEESLRAKLVMIFNHTPSPLPEDVTAEFLGLIKDDTKPLDETTVLSSMMPQSIDQVGAFVKPTGRDIAQAYTLIWAFRNRNNPANLVDLYSKLPQDKRAGFAMTVNVFCGSFINPDYFALEQKFLSDCVAETNAQDFESHSYYQSIEASLEATRFLLQTKNPQAVPAIFTILKNNVVSSQQRINMVFTLMASDNKQDQQVLRVVEWYFESYAFEPFDIKTLSQYLLTNADPLEAKSFIDNKAAQLRESLNTLNPPQPTKHITPKK